MTNIELALAAEVDTLSQHVALPPASVIVRQAVRRRRHRYAAALGVAAAFTAAAALFVPGHQPARDSLEGTPAAPRPAPVPDGQRLRSVFSALTPPVRFAGVQATEPQDHPAGALGSQPRQQSAGVAARTADNATTVTWAVLAPALTDDEADAVARTLATANGPEQGDPVLIKEDQSGRVRSMAYRFDHGSFIRIWAWSQDGGVATVTSGLGGTTPNTRVADLEAAARALLTDG